MIFFRKSIVLLLFFGLLVKISAQNKPFIVGESFTLQSTILKEERTLNIYLPEGYKEQDTIPYPVIYLLDGSANEDFLHTLGLVQFFVMGERMPKTILVGIENVDRKRDFTFPTTIAEDKKTYPSTGGSEDFIAFLEKELIPEINKRYRTTASKTLIGQSLGGLLGTEILFKKASLFSQYILVSPSLWWDKESLFLLSKSAAIPLTTPIFISVGKEHPIMKRDAKKLAKSLKRKGVEVHFRYLKEENHATILHRALYEAFKTLYQK